MKCKNEMFCWWDIHCVKKKMKSDLEIFSCKEIVVSHVRLLQILLISDGKQNNQEL